MTYECQDCQAEFEAESPRCPECGSIFDVLELCPMCGDPIDQDTRVCWRCKEIV